MKQLLKQKVKGIKKLFRVSFTDEFAVPEPEEGGVAIGVIVAAGDSWYVHRPVGDDEWYVAGFDSEVASKAFWDRRKMYKKPTTKAKIWETRGWDDRPAC